MYKKVFRYDEDNNSASSYIISRENEKVTIKHCRGYLISWALNHGLTEFGNINNYDTFHMHIKNIPALNKAILRVFRTPFRGRDMQDIVDNGETLCVYTDAEFGMNYIRIVNETDKKNRERFDITFEGELTHMDPDKRIPTEEMLWLTSTLQKIYDEWKKENK